MVERNPQIMIEVNRNKESFKSNGGNTTPQNVGSFVNLTTKEEEHHSIGKDSVAIPLNESMSREK
jgi:hypothetical protein